MLVRNGIAPEIIMCLFRENVGELEKMAQQLELGESPAALKEAPGLE